MLPRFSEIHRSLTAFEVPSRLAQQAATVAWGVLDPPDGQVRSIDSLIDTTGYARLTVDRAVNALKRLHGFQKIRTGIKVVNPDAWVHLPDGDDSERLDDEDAMRKVSVGIQRRKSTAAADWWDEEPVAVMEDEQPQEVPVAESVPLNDTAVALLRRGASDMSPVTDAFQVLMRAGDAARDTFELIGRLNQRHNIPHTSRNVYTDSVQETMDEVFSDFTQAFSEATGYNAPPIRSCCPICLHCVVVPVCLDCGHLVCHSCVVSPYLHKQDGRVKCPMCKKMGLWRKIYAA